MEAELLAHAWFAGPTSARRTCRCFPVELSRARGGFDASRARLTHFLERMHARPAYQRALAKGAAYALV
jgi:glutathione S-transferase